MKVHAFSKTTCSSSIPTFTGRPCACTPRRSGIAKSFNIPRVGLLLCLEDKDITAADSLLDTYKRSNAYTHQDSIGEVVVNAVFEKGAIAGNPGLEKARELGASLA